MATPVVVQYCLVCTLPPEYCAWSEVPHGGGEAGAGAAAEAEGAAAAAAAAEGAAEKLKGASLENAVPAEDAKPQKKKKEKKKAGVVITRATRNKRKCITTVAGLDLFGVKLQEAAKKIGKKFACGSSIVKDASQKEEIDVQGDFLEQMRDFLLKEFASSIAEGDITLVDKEKK